MKVFLKIFHLRRNLTSDNLVELLAQILVGDVAEKASVFHKGVHSANPTSA